MSLSSTSTRSKPPRPNGPRRGVPNSFCKFDDGSTASNGMNSIANLPSVPYAASSSPMPYTETTRRSSPFASASTSRHPKPSGERKSTQSSIIGDSCSPRSSCDASSFVTAVSDLEGCRDAGNFSTAGPSAVRRPASIPVLMNPTPVRRTRMESSTRKGKKRERSRSLDRRHPSLQSDLSSSNGFEERSISVAPGYKENDDVVQNSSQSSPNQFIEIGEALQLRQEIENLRKASAESHRTLVKQRKLIDELRSKAEASTQAKKEQDLELELIRSKARKQEELLASIESSLQCQICMELLKMPQAISPCGHILCLECLQEWFRNAPVNVDMEGGEDYTMYRAKTCPCCRAAVTKRPVPLFMVKAITAAISNAKAAARGLDPVLAGDQDPWQGLFPHSGGDDDSDSDSDDDDDDDDDRSFHGFESEEEALGFEDEDDMYDGDADDQELFDTVGPSWHHFTIDHGSDAEDEDHEDHDDLAEAVNYYATAYWEPPAYQFFPEQGDNFSLEQLKMVRRGCTMGMVYIFQMTYTHSEGLVAIVDSTIPGFETFELHRVYLGWNIHLDSNDIAGVHYMLGIMQDMNLNPYQWHCTPDEFGSGWCARKLAIVPLLGAQFHVEESDDDLYY